MTVAELIENLKALPQDMEIMVLDNDEYNASEIVHVSRGTWGIARMEAREAELEEKYGDDDIPEDVLASLEEIDEERFYQDDENGQLAVIVTW
jgi:hypothetical protein